MNWWKRHPGKLVGLLCGGLLLLSCWQAVLHAWQTPVFQQALEVWPAEPYRLTVLYEHDLQPTDLELLAWLDLQRQSGANLVVRQVDLREQPEFGERLTQTFRRNLPGMILQLPDPISERLGRPAHPVGWSEFNQAQAQQMLQSPAREILTQRLLAGQIVWVFLGSQVTSARPNQDDPLFELLEREVNQLKQQPANSPVNNLFDGAPTTIPPQTTEAASEADTASSPSADVRHSTLRIARNDPHEKWLIDMLLSIEPDLRNEANISQAMVFPVFGRGRALYALVGQGIEPQTIQQAATFLTSAPETAVPADEQGAPLLLPVLWDQQIAGRLILPGAQEEAEEAVEAEAEDEERRLAPDRPTLLTYSSDERGLSGTVAIVWTVAMMVVVFGTIILIWVSIVMRD